MTCWGGRSKNSPSDIKDHTIGFGISSSLVLAEFENEERLVHASKAKHDPTVGGVDGD